MNAHALAQYQLRLQDEYDNMKKRYSIGSVIEQGLWPLKGPIMITEYLERPARLRGHFIRSGRLVVIPAAMFDQLVGGRRRKSRRANRSRKSRRR